MGQDSSVAIHSYKKTSCGTFDKKAFTGLQGYS